MQKNPSKTHANPRRCGTFERVVYRPTRKKPRLFTIRCPTWQHWEAAKEGV